MGRLQRNHIAAITFVLERLHRSATASYQAELARFAGLPSNPAHASLIVATPSVTTRDETRALADAAKGWSEASTLMHTMLAARGMPYFHVLQPNQYFTTRSFSAEEAKSARSDASPFKKAAEAGYPILVRELDGLKTRVNLLNATGIFDREPAAVYIDDCCHYTLRGNQLLGAAIAKQILSSKGPWN